MRITKDMLGTTCTNPGIEPTKQQVEECSDKLSEFFYRHEGVHKTELSSKFLPTLARRRLDVKLGRDSGIKEAETGAAMFGNVGVGKTMLLKLSAFCLDADYFDVPSLSIMFSVKGPDAFWASVDGVGAKSDLILDDLGAEADSRNYGNSVPIIDLLYHRYNLWKNYGYRIWIGSNLSSSELIDRYGERAVDRIKEMCEIIPCTGDSMRK